MRYLSLTLWSREQPSDNYGDDDNKNNRLETNHDCIDQFSWGDIIKLSLLVSTIKLVWDIQQIKLTTWDKKVVIKSGLNHVYIFQPHYQFVLKIASEGYVITIW